MKIGIDARPLTYGNFSGIPTTVCEIIRVWMRCDSEHEYYLISDKELLLDTELPLNWHSIVRPSRYGNGTLWLFAELPKIINELHLTAFWGTNYLLPRRVKECRYLNTVYDLSFERYPYVTSLKTKIVLKAFCKRSCKIADAVFTISESSAKDIEKLYKIDKTKIRAIYLGGPETKKTDISGKVSETKKSDISERLSERYFLFLSTIEPRKNPLLVLKAYELYCKRYGTDINLVFAGSHGWNVDDFDRYLEKHPYRKNICMRGYVDNNEKDRLLARAEALLYPSVYEGFGLPILEAMNYGTPVITSDNSSMPEVGGDAAVYIHDITSEEELCELMRTVIVMPAEDRAGLKARMRINVSKFRWNICAEEVLKILTGTR